MSDIDADLLSIFRDEVGEYLANMNNTLLQIETAQADTETLRELNRVAHSMKGAARAVGLKVVETIAHYMEEVFDAALRRNLKLTPEVCDTLYDSLDLIQNVVDGGENEKDTLVAVLVHLEQVVALGADASEDKAEAAPPAARNDHDSQEIAVVVAAPIEAITPPLPDVPDIRVTPGITTDTATIVMRPAEDSIRVLVSKMDRLMAEASELLVIRMQGEERQREVQALRMLHRKWRREWQSMRAAYIRLARQVHDEHDEVSTDLATLFKFLERNQRHLLDASRQLTQIAQAMAQDTLRLTMLSDQLQDDISSMRLVSFESLLGGFQRIVRDLARDTEKQVHLEVTGTTVEVDKTVLDALKDPIMHLLRNAVDHGIEAPDQREARGKPAVGRVKLAVEQRGNEIIVRVGDDGRGINPASIRKSAVKAGILTAQEAEQLSDDDARSLIFHPGFTTSAQVTAISGRGIGMDVVRDRVESLRGRVSVQSVIGEGTTVSLSVPVSLTRIRCVLLNIGKEEYAIPSAVIARMITLKRDDIFTAENREMVIINEHPVPLVLLGDVLGIPSEPRSERHDSIVIVALRAADRTVAFEVDDLHSERELVLKPLGTEIARAQFVSGAALLGTGQVMIVLDANQLVRSAAGIALPRRRTIETPVVAPQKMRVLVVDDSITTRTLEKNILETAGFHVTVAIDGLEAWHMVNEADFDVVISDVEMPRMTGLELAREIKNSPRTRQIPVILLTSLGKPEHQQAGLKAGADAYLVKSQFDQGELLRMIWSVV
jgi:two-component system chemotaxis sensor kinase CheA